MGVKTPSLALTYTIEENLESGKSYSFNYFAVNIHGSGEVSDTVVIQAANNPARMVAPIVTLEPGLLYKVSFTKPNTGGVGIPIEEYAIIFRQKSGIF